MPAWGGFEVAKGDQVPPSVRMEIVLYVIRGRFSLKRYVGITNDLSRRLAEHRANKDKSSQLIGEFDLIHRESFASYAEARVREKYLKSGKGRQWMDQNLANRALTDEE